MSRPPDPGFRRRVPAPLAALLLACALAASAAAPTAPESGSQPATVPHGSPGLEAVDGTNPPEAAAGSAQATGAPDAPAAPARERALAEFASGGPGARDLVWLEADGARFMTLQRPAASGGRALIVVPGPGAYADGEPLLRALGTAPLAGGWSTLVLQAPLDSAPDGALCARLAAAAGHARADGAAALGVVALGEHGGPVLDCLASAPLAGLVGIAVLGRWTGPDSDPPAPLLELVPALDAEAMRLASGRARRWLGRAPGAHRQDRLAGVGPRFAGAEEEAAKRVRGWLERRLAAGGAAVRQARL